MKQTLVFFLAILLSSYSVAAPSVPSSVNASVINGNDIRISWSSVSGAARYERQYKINSGSWSPSSPLTHYGTTVTFTNQPARTSQYRIRACDASACSGWRTSNSITISIPSTPASVSASVLNGDDIRVAWSRVGNATYYERQYRVGSGTWSPNTPYQHTGTSVTFRNQPARTTQYRLRACNDLGCSGWKSSNSITISLSPPASVSASVINGNDIKITWTSVSGSTHYERQYNVSNSGWQPNSPSVHHGTSVTFSDQPARSSKYRVRACDTNGCSTWKESNSITVSAPSSPGTVTASVLNDNDLRVVWSSVSNATYYERQVKVDNGGWLPNSPYTHTGTSISADNQPARTTQYRVRACNNLGCSGYKESNSITIALLPPDSVNANVLNGKDIQISWSSVTDATYYERQYNVNSGAWQPTTPFTHEETSVTYLDQPARTTGYRLRACNLTSCSDWAESNLVVIHPAPETVTAEVENGNDIRILWSEVAGATSYEREYKVNGQEWTSTPPISHTTTSLFFSNQPPRTTQYRLRACNAQGCSGWTESNAIVVTLQPPAAVTAEVVNDDQINVNWSAVVGATHYERQYNVDGGSWLPNTPFEHIGTSLAFPDQPPRTTQYRLRACDASGCTDWVESNSVTVNLAAPESLTATVENGHDIEMSWPELAGELSYKLQANLNNAGWQWASEDINVHNYSLPAQASGSWLFRLQVCSASSCSDWTESNQVVIHPAPETVTAEVENGNDIRIQWSAVVGATSYEREYKTDDSDWASGWPIPPTKTFLVFTNQPPHTTQYRLRACNAQGCSGWTESNSITIGFFPPAMVEATIENTDDIRIRWSEVYSATHYERQFKANNGSWWPEEPMIHYETEVLFLDQPPRITQYRVRACDSSSCTAWTESNAVSIGGSVVWGESSVVVGQQVSVLGLNTDVEYCQALGEPSIRFTYNPIENTAVFFQVTESATVDWQCFDLAGEPVQTFAASIEVNRLRAPENLKRQ